MDPRIAELITEQRLAPWITKLMDENATPVFLMGVSHGDKSGNLVLCTTEDLPLEVMIAFMEKCVSLLKQKL